MADYGPRLSAPARGGTRPANLGLLCVKIDIFINVSSSLELCECVLDLSIVSAVFGRVAQGYDGASYPGGLLDTPGSDALLARLLRLDPGLLHQPVYFFSY